MRQSIVVLAVSVAALWPAVAAAQTCPDLRLVSTGGSPYVVLRLSPDSLISQHSDLHTAAARALTERVRHPDWQIRIRQTLEIRAEGCIPTVRVDTVTAVRVDTITIVRVDTVRMDTAVVDTTPPAPVPQPVPPGTGNLTPPELLAVLGPLVARDTALRQYDARYMQTERARFREWAANPAQLTVGFAMHYGSLRGRLSWAIRNGEPYGANVPQGDTTTAYGRGRLPVQWYLLNYARPNKYAIPAHNNTALADIELYWLLERDSLARTHIVCTAAAGLYDTFGYLRLQNPNTDARIVAVTLQAMDAAQRLGFAYGGCPANMNYGRNPAYASWREAGDSIIARLDAAGAIGPDGSIRSPAHEGNEAFFMNALLAVQLLGWHRTAPHARADELARMILDHLVAEDDSAAAKGWATLPYQSDSTGPAPDLAAYYVFPALVLWQETGEPKYRDFALRSLRATGSAYLGGLKQWNQVYSTMAQSTEAMLSGLRWR